MSTFGTRFATAPPLWVLLFAGVVFAAIARVVDTHEVWTIPTVLLAMTACVVTPFAVRLPVRVGVILILLELVSLLVSAPYFGWAALGQPFAVGSAQAHGRRKAAALLAVTMAAVNTVSLFPDPEYGGWNSLRSTVMLYVVAIVLGEVIYRIIGRERRAVEAARLRGEAERREVARALHDTIVYATTLMVMRADAIRVRPNIDPVSARDLEFISRTGRQATEDLRTMLMLLRQNDALPELSVGNPSLGEAIEEQIQKLRLNGFEATVMIEGEDDLDRLPLVTSRALSRVLLESTVNITKHAQQFSAVQLMVDIRDNEVELLLTNRINQRKPAHRPERAFGLAGLGEIVESLDGELVAGRQGPDSWATHVRLPVVKR